MKTTTVTAFSLAAIAAAALVSAPAFSEPPIPAVTAEKDDSRQITLTATYHGCTKDHHLGTFVHTLPFRPVDPSYKVTEDQLESLRRAYAETLGVAKNEFIKMTMSARSYEQIKTINPFGLNKEELELMARDEKALIAFHEKVKQILDNQSSHGDEEAQRLLNIGFKYTLVLSKKKMERSYTDTPSPACK